MPEKTNKYAPQAKWAKANIKRFDLKFMCKSDADIIAKLNEVPNRADYIRQLIRADLQKED